MEFFFTDPNVEKLPPEKTRFLDLRAEPNPDGKRIRVSLDLTPFQKRPYIELTLTRPDGRVVSSASIVEPTAWKLELTLHIREPISTEPGPGTEASDVKTSSCTLSASLSYPDLGEIDQHQITVECKQN
jgi:hypothetical protein